MPAPTCTKSDAPSVTHASSASTNFTGAVACFTQMAFASAADSYRRPEMHETTARCGACTGSPPTSCAMPASMPAISGEWNACDTSSRVHLSPAAESRCCAASMPGVVPERTTCVGWLWFARAGAWEPRGWDVRQASRWPSTSGAEAITANIAPGSVSSSSFISWPRRATRDTASSALSMPAEAAAANSPNEWPSATSAVRPSVPRSSLNANPNAAIAGWHTSVRVRCACAADGSVRSFG